MTYRNVCDESEHLTISVQEACEYIQQLDLDYIIQAMCAPGYSLPRWTAVDAAYCAQLYKNFLILLKENPREELVPTREIDEFWHNHILYTKNYHHDCLNIFGHYLHHEPASPMDDPAKLVNNHQKTKAYYLKKFLQPLEIIGSAV
jgi:hypothetical protein